MGFSDLEGETSVSMHRRQRNLPISLIEAVEEYAFFNRLNKEEVYEQALRKFLEE